MNDTIIVERLEQVAKHVEKAVDAGKQNDWREAEQKLQRAQTSMVTAMRLVELANDIRRIQVR